ncbi:MAG: hypothetical protein JOY80_02700 [Candidatus Dormibacteraeota bacterium]|nr:hypothetical protein [Candidatus Dormibacteraeota bacterium]
MPEFARVSTFQVDAGRIDDAITFFNGTDLEDAAGARGFRRGFWLLDRSSGKGIEMVVFESRGALDAAEGEETEARSEAEAAGVQLSSEEFYEVVAEGKPPG